MKDHIIADHRFNRRLFVNPSAALTGIVVPVPIQLTDPIENVLGKNLTIFSR